MSVATSYTAHFSPNLNICTALLVYLQALGESGNAKKAVEMLKKCAKLNTDDEVRTVSVKHNSFYYIISSEI